MYSWLRTVAKALAVALAVFLSVFTVRNIAQQRKAEKVWRARAINSEIEGTGESVKAAELARRRAHAHRIAGEQLKAKAQKRIEKTKVSNESIEDIVARWSADD